MRTEIEISTSNYMQEVASDLACDFKMMFKSFPQELGWAIFRRPASGHLREGFTRGTNSFFFFGLVNLFVHVCVDVTSVSHVIPAILNIATHILCGS